MNNELSNEEIARVFAMYLGAPVFIGIQEGTGKPTREFVTPKLLQEITDGNWLGKEENPTELLLLKPLSSISGEDAVDFVSEFYCRDKKEIYKVEVLDEGLRFSYPSVLSCYKPFNELFATQHQFLINRNYAVPIWPWNKTAIELGIAIDSTLK